MLPATKEPAARGCSPGRAVGSRPLRGRLLSEVQGCGRVGEELGKHGLAPPLTLSHEDLTFQTEVTAAATGTQRSRAKVDGCQAPCDRLRDRGAQKTPLCHARDTGLSGF